MLHPFVIGLIQYTSAGSCILAVKYSIHNTRKFIRFTQNLSQACILTVGSECYPVFKVTHEGTVSSFKLIPFFGCKLLTHCKALIGIGKYNIHPAYGEIIRKHRRLIPCSGLLELQGHQFPCFVPCVIQKTRSSLSIINEACVYALLSFLDLTQKDVAYAVVIFMEQLIFKRTFSIGTHKKYGVIISCQYNCILVHTISSPILSRLILSPSASVYISFLLTRRA